MAPKEIKHKIDKFIKEAKKNISIEKVILFGSATKGKTNKSSDLDLAIISKDFYAMTPIERLTLLGKIAWFANVTEIEALGYSPKEYQETSKFDFLYEIKRTGKIVYS